MWGRGLVLLIYRDSRGSYEETLISAIAQPDLQKIPSSAAVFNNARIGLELAAVTQH